MPEHFPIKLYKQIFFLAGLNIGSLSGKFEKFYLLIASVLYILLILPQVFAVLLSPTILEKLNAFVYLFASSSTGIILAWLHLQRSTLVNLYNQICHDYHQFDSSICAIFESKLKRKIIYLGCYFMLFIPIIFWMPYFIKYYSDSEEVDPTIHLFFPAVYPWSVRSILSYNLTMMFQTVVVSIAFPIIAAATSGVHYFHVLFSIHLQQLQFDIKLLDESTVHDEVHNIRNIILKHRSLKKSVDESKAAIMAYIYVSVLSFFLSGSLMTLSLFSFSGNFLYYIRTFSYQFSFICNLIFCTQLGQLYFEITMYVTKWYTKSATYRKYIIIFMMTLQRRWEIRILKLKYLNWYYISDISKFTYSALQLLLNLKN